VIPLTSADLEDAPKVDLKPPLSGEDRSLLDQFYLPHAA